METFEEMKERYRQDMLRYARQVRPDPPAEQPRAIPVQQKQSLSAMPKQKPQAVLVQQKQTIPRIPEPVQPPKPAVPAEQQPAVLPDREERDTGTAMMVVRTFTAREALPVGGALVIISRQIQGQPTLQWTGLTDESGNTPSIPLPAPAASLSEEPGHPQPYATYTIQAAKDGFYTAEFRGVPVFAGVSTVQPVEMIPLPEQADGSRSMIVVEREPDDL
ncbi:MAG: carboxypeptidase-like regulatory domain-containing protein [Oscillospiraceae bacterium]|nr:carboxypeptidase-like regulatory domain-containing protein [Oscillospiraceae bacterium]